MSTLEKMWDGVRKVMDLTGKVDDTSKTLAKQQAKIEDLTERVIRLETALEIAMTGKLSPRDKTTKHLPSAD